MNRSPTPRSVSIFTADFRRLKFTHTGAQVFDGIPGPRKLQCEVFSPLSLGLVESHCTRLPASSTQPLEAMMHDDLSRRVWLAGLSDGKSPHIKRPHSLKTMRLTMRNVSRFRNAKIGVEHCWASLHEHRGRTHDRKWRRGGYPLGSGGIEASHKCMCHVRLKRSGAWWYEVNSNQMLALRCAKYPGTLDQVVVRGSTAATRHIRIT